MNIDTSNLDYMQTILKLTGLSDKQPVGFPRKKLYRTFKAGRMEKMVLHLFRPGNRRCPPRSTAPDSSAVRGCMQFMRIPLHQRAWNDYELFVKE